MTDLEITRLCAEAMGMEVTYVNWPEPETDRSKKVIHAKFPDEKPIHYYPLHDDAQAMALVKRFTLEPRWNIERQKWLVSKSYRIDPSAWSGNLNRAICECVAKMQAAK